MFSRGLGRMDIGPGFRRRRHLPGSERSDRGDRACGASRPRARAHRRRIRLGVLARALARRIVAALRVAVAVSRERADRRRARGRRLQDSAGDDGREAGGIRCLRRGASVRGAGGARLGHQ